MKWTGPDSYLGGGSSGGSGEANTASSVGGGVEVFKQKVGVDLEFRSISSNDVYLDGDLIRFKTFRSDDVTRVFSIGEQGIETPLIYGDMVDYKVGLGVTDPATRLDLGDEGALTFRGMEVASEPADPLPDGVVTFVRVNGTSPNRTVEYLAKLETGDEAIIATITNGTGPPAGGGGGA